jgi:shikimate dehydrogenase
MRKYGLIGYPLGHSFSKTYFTRKFLTEGIIDCSYDNFPLTSLELFPKLLDDEPDLAGLNVTIPYKSEIFRFLSSVDPEAAEIGAVNVLKIRREGKKTGISGFNSDVTGIRDSLLPYIDRDLTDAIILGTGGSSRAVRYVLMKSGINVILVSRNRKPGILGYSDLDAEILARARLIVNTTPLGMFPGTGSRPDINYSLLGEKHILFDLVYNPEFTLFLKSGIERGCKVITGLKMLHSQAERSWQIWNDGNI